ncbi:MAG: UV damage endonuclease UvsE, partial [Anaerolineae bacterium]|nr:UV damage endonuclease UvsE [Anaerolineae bacterium]
LDPRLAPGPPVEALAQVEACAVELAYVGRLARAADIRLTMHAPPGVMLGAANERVAAGAAARLTQLATLLDGLGAVGGVIVTHVGGEGAEGRARWGERARGLPEATRARLAVEHDLGHTAAEVVDMARVVGVPVVFDLLHHHLRPGGLATRAGLAQCLATWSTGGTPEVHLSSPRTEAHLRQRGGQLEARLPRPEEHADLIHPFDLVYLLEMAEGLPNFDVFLEARASDVAVARARDDLRRYAPQWVDRIA